MQYFAKLALSVLLPAIIAGGVQAQSAPERAAALRAQLIEVQAQQTNLQVRLAQLDEAMKPENIANSLAGVGSTHPEDLREMRRRQLEKEKAGVTAQLDQLAASQRRLETALNEADAAAYQQSARPGDVDTKGPQATTVESSTPTNARTVRHRSRRARARRHSSPR